MYFDLNINGESYKKYLKEDDPSFINLLISCLEGLKYIFIM